MPMTKVQIISNALTILGKKPIISLVNQSDIVTAAEQAFDMLLPSIISRGFWRFATRILPLSQVTPVPLGGYWTYAYALPADYVKHTHTWPLIYDFEVYEGNLLYSNYNDSGQQLFLEYQFVPVIQNIPDYFLEYFIYEIATYLALSNAQSVQYASYLQPQVAVKMAQALAADSQNRPQTPLQSKPMISRRYVSTFASG